MPQSIKVVAIVFVLLGGMIGFDSAQSDDGTLSQSKTLLLLLLIDRLH